MEFPHPDEDNLKKKAAEALAKYERKKGPEVTLPDAREMAKLLEKAISDKNVSSFFLGQLSGLAGKKVHELFFATEISKALHVYSAGQKVSVAQGDILASAMIDELIPDKKIAEGVKKLEHSLRTGSGRTPH